MVPPESAPAQVRFEVQLRLQKQSRLQKQLRLRKQSRFWAQPRVTYLPLLSLHLLQRPVSSRGLPYSAHSLWQIPLQPSRLHADTGHTPPGPAKNPGALAMRQTLRPLQKTAT
jgi:hypothetical protein